LSESETIRFRPRDAGAQNNQSPGNYLHPSQGSRSAQTTAFTRSELDAILSVYARYVAAGEWRDYALEMGRDKAIFAIFQRSSEFPLFRIEKCPKLARKQGAYSVVSRTGVILKRGHELRNVLSVLDGLKLVRA